MQRAAWLTYTTGTRLAGWHVRLADAVALQLWTRLPPCSMQRCCCRPCCSTQLGAAGWLRRKPNPIIHRDLKPGNLMLSGGQYQDQMQIVFDTGVVKLVSAMQ